MLSPVAPSTGANTAACTCPAISRSFDTRRVSFGSVEVFGSPEVSRSLDDIEAYRKVCKRKGVPLYSTLPQAPPATITGTSPSKVFPIFGFFFSPAQPILTPSKVPDGPDSDDVQQTSADDDSSPEGQSPALSRSSSVEVPSVSASSPSPSGPKSILKTTGSYKTSPGYLTGSGGCLNAACASCKGSLCGTVSDVIPVFVNGGSNGEGLFTAQLPPRPTPKRSLLRQAVHNMQQTNSARPTGSEEGAGSGSDMAAAEEVDEKIQPPSNSTAVAVWGRDMQNGSVENGWVGSGPRPMQQPPAQVMSYSAPVPVLRSYADSSRDDAAAHKQPLLGQEHQTEGEEEEWEEDYEVELCSWCPPCMQSLLLGNGSTPSSKLIRI